MFYSKCSVQWMTIKLSEDNRTVKIKLLLIQLVILKVTILKLFILKLVS